MRVMYVEDEADIQELTCLALQSIGGFEVSAYSSGQEALEKVDKIGALDLVLLDVMMPEMDGKTLFRKLQDNPKVAETPVIFMTAKTFASEVEELKNLGALDVVPKPFDPLTLAQDLTSLVEQHSGNTHAAV